MLSVGVRRRSPEGSAAGGMGPARIRWGPDQEESRCFGGVAPAEKNFLAWAGVHLVPLSVPQCLQVPFCVAWCAF